MNEFVMLQCSNNQCNIRFPAPKDDYNTFCPLCGDKLSIYQYNVNNGYAHFHKNTGVHLECALDNIRSAYNVGSILRSANGFGIDTVHLCGVSPSPFAEKVKKTSLGAEYSISWCYHPNALDLVTQKKRDGFHIFSIETSPSATSILDIHLESPAQKVLFILGNEIFGIDPEIQRCSDAILQIPVTGQKKSLNVATSFAIASFYFSQLFA